MCNDMEMEIFSFWPLFFIAVASQGFFLAIILGLQKSAKSSNWMLAILIGLFSISILDTLVFWVEYYRTNPHLLGWSLSFRFIYGPLFYFYLLQTIGSKRDIRKKLWLHLLPVFGALLWYSPYYLSDATQKLYLIDHWNFNIVNALLLPVLGLLSLSYYAFISWQFIQKVEQTSGVKIRGTDHWLAAIFKSYVLFVVFNYAYLITAISGLSSKLSDIIIILAYSIFIYFIGYLGLKMSQLFNPLKTESSKYQATALPASLSKTMFDKLKAHLEHHQSYRNNQLKLAHLAEELSLSPHHLSQVINRHAQKNFSEFINDYRIKEAIQLINQIDRINQLAYEVGFNNRTTFNKAFKKATGLTPTQYKRKTLLEKGK